MFDDLDPTLSLLCDVICPCQKICGRCQIRIPRSIHPQQRCPTQKRLKETTTAMTTKTSLEKTFLVLLCDSNSFNLYNVAKLSSNRTGGNGIQVETENGKFTIVSCSCSTQNLEFVVWPSTAKCTKIKRMCRAFVFSLNPIVL